jgi:curli biogenesis system outer membrane secretion channel CsgG
MRAGSILAAAVLAIGCVTDVHRATQPVAIESLGAPSAGPTYRLLVGPFQNRSPYLQGAFGSGVDPLGTQAESLLKMHLKLTGRFVVLERAALDEKARQAALRGDSQAPGGPPVAITGDVAEFGRRQTGDGILGYGKKPVVYAAVTLNVVDVRTEQVTYAVQGAGEYPLADGDAARFGTIAGYDARVNGKVLNRAILQAVDRLVAGLERGDWSPTPVR